MTRQTKAARNAEDVNHFENMALSIVAAHRRGKYPEWLLLNTLNVTIYKSSTWKELPDAARILVQHYIWGACAMLREDTVLCYLLPDGPKTAKQLAVYDFNYMRSVAISPYQAGVATQTFYVDSDGYPDVEHPYTYPSVLWGAWRAAKELAESFTNG